MANNQLNQKKRQQNFLNLEKIKLIELIERKKNIIENKKTDNVLVSKIKILVGKISQMNLIAIPCQDIEISQV